MPVLSKWLIMRSILFLIFIQALTACGIEIGNPDSVIPDTPKPTTDTTAPVIRLNGSLNMTINVGSIFIDPGAIATDNIDGNVVVRTEGQVNSNIAGQYILRYVAEDSAGNQSTATRTVEVVTVDTQKPVITIIGEKEVFITEGDSYSDMGATAVDETDGVITVSTTGTVNTDIPDTYTITYSATDKTGNTATAIRLVIVTQKQTPKFEVSGNFLVGRVIVPLSNTLNGEINLHVQRFNKDGNNWTQEPLSLADGRNAETVFTDVKARIQEFYQDMINRGMPLSEMQQMLSGITGGEKSGVHIVTGNPACYYEGAPRRLICNPNIGWWTLAHESMHGWHWNEAVSPTGDEVSILIQDIFTRWANFVYHTRQENPDLLRGTSDMGMPWVLSYLDYGLQNDAEWLAETFAGWLYNSHRSNGAMWEAMKKSAPEFEVFFNCLWLDGKSLTTCNDLSFNQNAIKHPQYKYPEGVADVAGFSQEDKVAIWKVCMGAPDASNYKNHFNSIVSRVAPNLPGSPADHYVLGYGDCNHDGTTDWICAYSGRGPTGLGNGNYLWNKENKVGTYTFIASGKEFDSYAEYKQDPYSTLRSMASGAIAQPQFREWQGQYGSCNGAQYFRYRSQPWIDLYLKDIPK